eukprot:m.213153 g.213153  ORF g.213153 m.213153 type:complete len:670 (+) comp23422_c0_seq1:39-2048(+)
MDAILSDPLAVERWLQEMAAGAVEQQIGSLEEAIVAVNEKIKEAGDRKDVVLLLRLFDINKTLVNEKEVRLAAQAASEKDKAASEKAKREEAEARAAHAATQAAEAARAMQAAAEVAARAEARAAEAAAQAEAKAIGKTLWKDGFPKLVCKLSQISTEGHVPSDKAHRKAAMLEKPFCFDRVHTTPKPSMVWTSVDDNDVLKYSNEATTHSHVENVVKDVTRHLRDLPGFKDLQLEISREMNVGPTKPDIWVVTRFGMPIGVVEVKMPRIEEAGQTNSFPMDEPNVHGQMLDYLVALRNMHNVAAFGILTTYRHWRICWLPESDEVAAAPPVVDLTRRSVSEAVELLQPSNPAVTAASSASASASSSDPAAASSRPIRGAKEKAKESIAANITAQLSGLDLGDSGRELRSSKMLQWDEPDLIHVLFSAFRKMCTLQLRLSLDDILRPERQCVVVMAEHQHTKIYSLPATITPTTLDLSRLAGKDTSEFFLLHQLGAGVDGVVFLACDNRGVHAVLKFAKQGREDAVVEESRRWRRLPDVNAGSWCGVLSSMTALAIPYFRPAHLSDATPAEKMTAARSAVERMANAGMQHADLSWRHVGLYRRSDNGALDGVLFDLAAVNEFPAEDVQRRAQAIDAMWAKLGQYEERHPHPAASDGVQATPTRAVVSAV